MKDFEFNNLVKEHEKLITVKDLENKNDRLLLKGYTSFRDGWEVWLIDEEIKIYMFEKDSIRIMEANNNKDYCPDKRVYPQESDYEFCKLLLQKGINIPFTKFN